MDLIEKLKNTIISYGLAKNYEIEGCNNEEIKKLERKYNTQLPQIYREYLMCMGKNQGKHPGDSEYLYPSLFELKELLKEVLTECGSKFILPEDAFVFYQRLGADFMFFQTDQKSDDPPIFGYQECHNEQDELFDSFSDYLKKWIKNIEKRKK